MIKMGEKAQRRFDLKKSLIRAEFLLNTEYMQSLNSHIIFGNVLDNKYEDIDKCDDILKIINTFNDFPTIVAQAMDKNTVYSMIKITKEIPSILKKRMLYIPKDTVTIAMMDVCENEVEDRIILFTVDNYGQPLIVSEDNRLLKKEYRGNPRILERNANIYNTNIKTYFNIFYAFLKSEYILAYIYNGSTVYFPLIREDEKDLFKNREKDGERRRPIPYGVNEYKNRHGVSYMSHMRGKSDFVQEGRNLTLMIGEEKWSKYQKTVKEMNNYQN